MNETPSNKRPVPLGRSHLERPKYKGFSPHIAKFAMSLWTKHPLPVSLVSVGTICWIIGYPLVATGMIVGGILYLLTGVIDTQFVEYLDGEDE